MRRALLLVFAFAMIGAATQAQLLKKIKDKTEKALSGKTETTTQDSKETGSTSSTASSTSSTSSGSSATNREFAAAKYGTKLAALRKGEQLMYDEVGVVSLNGTQTVTFITRLGKEYFLYENDVVSGPFPKPPIEKIKGYKARTYSEEEGRNSKTADYMKMNAKYQQELVIGGKKYGPYTMVMQLSVSPDQSKFFAVVAEPNGKYALVTPKGKTALPGIATEWFVSPNYEKCGMVFTEDQLKGKEDPSMDVNAPRYLLLNDGSKIGPIADMYSSERSFTNNGQLVQKKNNDSKQLYVNGKPGLKFPIDISSIDGVMLNETAASGAIFDNGNLHFSDGTNIGYMVIKPNMQKQDGKNFVEWLSYDSQSNIMYACKKEL